MGKFRGGTMNTVKTHAVHGVKQVELLNWLLNNLQQFNLKPTTKLVLLYLAGCYNPKHADVFPKQKTIALQMGISERSVISAISDLHKEGLVISERKYTNRYKFTAKILNLGAHVEDFSEAKCKDCTLESENFAPPYIEQEKEQIKEQHVSLKNVSLEDYKILKNYAQKNGARNINAYINKLLSCGSGGEIIKAARQVKENSEARKKETQELLQRYEQEKQTACSPVEYTREQAIEYIKSMNPMFWSSGCCARLIQKYALQDMF